MKNERPIDRVRNSAATIRVGGEDSSEISEMLSTSDGLYVLRGNSVHRVRLADEIDPGRTNIAVPNVSQSVLDAGTDNDIVATILLTSKELFDHQNATVSESTSLLFERCVDLTKKMLDLDNLVSQISSEILSKADLGVQAFTSVRSVHIPSCPGLESRVTSILLQADKVREALLGICKAEWVDASIKKPRIEDIDAAARLRIGSETDLGASWDDVLNYLKRLRDYRNACEHPKDGQTVVVEDFSVQPDGAVCPPILEVQHKVNPQSRVLVTDFLLVLRQDLLMCAELILVLVGMSRLSKIGSSNVRIFQVPEEQRRKKYVRFYRAINIHGNWHILG